MAATARNIRSVWLRRKRPKPPKKKNWALARKLLNWKDLKEGQKDA
jgi:hypothetical protein